MSKHTETKNQQPKTRYTNFYLTMLIISTAMTIFAIPAFSEIIRMIEYFTVAPLFVTLLAINLALLVVSFVGLVFLFQKRQLGIVLTLGSYIAGFLLLIPMIFYIDQMIAYTLTSMSPTEIRDSGGKEAISTLLTILYYAVLVVGALITPPFTFLWYYAWRKQEAADRKSSKNL